MNNTLENQLNHRTIREFKDKKVDEETLNTLFEVANHTASSVAMQSYSIIHITDEKKKKDISEVCKQEYVATAPELLIFIVDLYRNANISKEMGENIDDKINMDKFFQGFTDGAIACQNMYTAIESLGMGGVYLGSILNDSAKIIEILELPPLTFPIVGLGFGYPDQDPQLKPRMDISLKVFQNKYKIQDNYLESIKEYDNTMQNYYDLRDTAKPLDSFSKQVVMRFTTPNEKRARILNVIKKQGFKLKLEE